MTKNAIALVVFTYILISCDKPDTKNAQKIDLKQWQHCDLSNAAEIGCIHIVLDSPKVAHMVLGSDGSDGSDETISVAVKGEYFNAYNGKGGAYYKKDVAKIIKTTKANWKAILKHADQDKMYQRWVYGFLKANIDGLRSCPTARNTTTTPAPNNNVTYCELYDMAPYSDREKLDFLEALYGVGGHKLEIGLPNDYTTSGASKAERLFLPMMATFVAHYQPLLLNTISSSNDLSMNNLGDNIKKLAAEATPQGAFSDGNPEIVATMVQSAFGSALSAVKLLLNLSIKVDNADNYDQEPDLDKVIVNAGLVINNTLKAHPEIAEVIGKNSDKAFDKAWDAIPFSKNFTETAKAPLKSAAKAIYSNFFNREYDDASGVKNGMKSKLANLKGVIKDAAEALDNDGHQVNYSVLANRFNAMKNTFGNNLND